MKLSKRAKLEIEGQLKRDLSWQAHAHFVTSQLEEKKNQLQQCSGDITKILLREQLLGQILFLEKHSEYFHNHVANVIDTENDNNVK